MGLERVENDWSSTVDGRNPDGDRCCPLTGIVGPLPNGRTSMAYKGGWSLLTFNHWTIHWDAPLSWGDLGRPQHLCGSLWRSESGHLAHSGWGSSLAPEEIFDDMGKHLQNKISVGNHHFHVQNNFQRGGFKYFFIFSPTWGNDPIWLL